MSEKLYGIIAKVMDISIDEITDNSSPETIPSWDSFNSYILLDELESEFKTEFTLDEITETKNVSDIKKNLKIHGIILDE
jgi:acyl carrier protein